MQLFEQIRTHMGYPYSRKNGSVFDSGSSYFQNSFPTAWQPFLSHEKFRTTKMLGYVIVSLHKERSTCSVTNYCLLCRIT